MYCQQTKQIHSYHGNIPLLNTSGNAQENPLINNVCAGSFLPLKYYFVLIPSQTLMEFRNWYVQPNPNNHMVMYMVILLLRVFKGRIHFVYGGINYFLSCSFQSTHHPTNLWLFHQIRYSGFGENNLNGHCYFKDILAFLYQRIWLLQLK